MSDSGSTISQRLTLEGANQFKAELDRIRQAGEAMMRSLQAGGQASAAGLVQLSSATAEVQRHFYAMGQAATQSGNQTRAALLAATQSVASLREGMEGYIPSSRQVGFATRDLGFEFLHIGDAINAGISPMRAFSSESGRIIAAITIGGGLRSVFDHISTSVSNFITPGRIAAAGMVALGVAILLVVERAENADAAARRFDVILQGMGKSSLATGAQLEKAAENLRNVGMSADEARKNIASFLQQGGRPQDSERIIRIGKDLEAVLGEGSLKEFITAAAKGGAPLEEFAKRLGIIPQVAKDANAQLHSLTAEIEASRLAIEAIYRGRARSIQDANHEFNLQMVDLFRKRGNEVQELAFAHNRRLQEIERQTTRQINEEIRKRNVQAAADMKKYNKEIEEEADKAINTGQGLIALIEGRVKGAADRSLGPLAHALRDLGVAWNDFLNGLAKSSIFAALVTALAAVLKGVVALQVHTGIPGITIAVGLAVTALATFSKGLVYLAGTAISGVVKVIGGLVRGINAVARAFGFLNVAAAPWLALGIAITLVIATLVAVGPAAERISNLIRKYIGDDAADTFDKFVKFVRNAFADLTQWFLGIVAGWADDFAKWVGKMLAWVDKLIDRVTKLGGLLGGNQLKVGSEGEAAMQPGFNPGDVSSGTNQYGNPMVLGGHVRGPGGTDRVPIWATAGEFVQRVSAVQHYGVDFMHRLNNLQVPKFNLGGLVGSFMPRSAARMSVGGSIAAAASGRSVNLYVDDHKFAMRASERVASSLVETARTSATIRASRPPSWKGQG